MAPRSHDLQIAGIIQETPDARSFVLGVPDELRGAFEYEAGQFLTFEIPWQSMELRRCYSLSSAPATDPWLKVTVKRVDDGRVSNWFNDTLKVGDVISVQPPEGRFVLHAQSSTRPLMLFGGGSGITPVISLLKQALRTTEREVKLVYANRDRASIIFHDELELWCAEFAERLEVVHHLDDQRGFLTEADVAPMLEGWQSAEFYVCGPAEYMNTVEHALKTAGVALQQMKFERFVSLPDPDRRQAIDEAAATEAKGPAPSSFRITLEGKEHDVPYLPGCSLLEAAVKAGHQPPSSCEDGYCGCCMAMLKNGKVTMRTQEALTKDDIAQGWVLTCQSRPSSDEPLHVDYDAEY